MPPSEGLESNYPRNRTAYSARMPGVYLDTIGTAFRMIREDFGTYAVCALICAAASLSLDSVLSVVQGIPFGSFAWARGPHGLVAGFLTDALDTVFLMGMAGIGIRHALGNWPRITDLFLPFKQPDRTVLSTLLYMIPTAIGAVGSYALETVLVSGPLRHSHLVFEVAWFVVVNLFFGPLIMGLSAAMFTKMPILDAFREGFRRTGYQGLLLSLVFAVATIVAASGFVLCCVGILFTGPILSNVIALHYLYFFPPGEPDSDAMKPISA